MIFLFHKCILRFHVDFHFYMICFESYFFTSLSRYSVVSFSFCTKTFRMLTREIQRSPHGLLYKNRCLKSTEAENPWRKHQSNILKDLFVLNSWSGGMSVYVCCPSLSLLERFNLSHYPPPLSSLACGGSNSFPKAYAGGCKVSKELNPLECIDIQCKKHPNCLRFGKNPATSTLLWFDMFLSICSVLFSHFCSWDTTDTSMLRSDLQGVRPICLTSHWSLCSTDIISALEKSKNNNK